jgi:hypothetical protein
MLLNAEDGHPRHIMTGRREAGEFTVRRKTMRKR